MVLTPSTMLPLGTKAPDFSLPNVDGKTRLAGRSRRRQGLSDRVHVQPLPVRDPRGRPSWPAWRSEYQKKGRRRCRHQRQRRRHAPGRLARADGARSRNARLHVSVPLRRDRRTWPKPITPPARPTSTSSTRTRQLAYRGQLDSSRPDSGVPLTGADLRAALDAVLAGKPASRPTRSPASAATSSGSPAASPTTSRAAHRTV